MKNLYFSTNLKSGKQIKKDYILENKDKKSLKASIKR